MRVTKRELNNLQVMTQFCILPSVSVQDSLAGAILRLQQAKPIPEDLDTQVWLETHKKTARLYPRQTSFYPEWSHSFGRRQLQWGTRIHENVFLLQHCYRTDWNRNVSDVPHRILLVAATEEYSTASHSLHQHQAGLCYYYPKCNSGHWSSAKLYDYAHMLQMQQIVPARVI